MMTTAPPDERLAIVLDLLRAAGWAGSDGDRTWISPDESASLTVADEEDPAAPLYGLHWRGTDIESVTMQTTDPRRVVDTIAAVGLIPEPAWLYAEDVAALWTEEAAAMAELAGRPAPARPISPTTVWDTVTKLRSGRRHADNPMPEATYASAPRGAKPVRGDRPRWHILDGPALRAWYRSRPGPGARTDLRRRGQDGGGQPPRNQPEGEG